MGEARQGEHFGGDEGGKVLVVMQYMKEEKITHTHTYTISLYSTIIIY